MAGEMTPGGSRRITPGDSTPGGSRHLDSRNHPQPEIRPGDIYGRMPMPPQQTSYYQDGGGYGVPGTRKSLTDAENARRAAEAEIARRNADSDNTRRNMETENSRRAAENERRAAEDNRISYQSSYQQGNQRNSSIEMTPRSNKDERMQSLGVYVSRTPIVKTPDSRTPDFNRSRTEFLDRRSICQSNERLDVTSESVSADRASGSDNQQKVKSSGVEDSKTKDDCGRDDLDDDDGGFTKGGAGSDYEKLRGGGQSDSGRGSTVYSSGKAKTERQVDTSPEPLATHGKSCHCNSTLITQIYIF